MSVGIDGVPTTQQFSSTAEPVPTATDPSCERTTAPCASSDPSPNRAAPRTTAEWASCGEPAVGSETALPGPAVMRWRGSREVPGRERLGGHGAEPPGLVVLDRLDDLVAGVHHEGPIVHDRFTDR